MYVCMGLNGSESKLKENFNLLLIGSNFKLNQDLREHATLLFPTLFCTCAIYCWGILISN